MNVEEKNVMTTGTDPVVAVQAALVRSKATKPPKPSETSTKPKKSPENKGHQQKQGKVLKPISEKITLPTAAKEMAVGIFQRLGRGQALRVQQALGAILKKAAPMAKEKSKPKPAK